MAQECGFFNAQLVDGEYDRVYLAEQFAAYFASFIGNGIFGNSMQELEVVSSNNMTTKVLSGQGWINGWWYRNTSDCTLSHSLADGILSRIDVIVLRWDNSARDMYLHIIEGVPSVNPVKPDIVRDSDYYDLQLAYVSIPKGSVRISQSQITDTRLDNSVCGLVTGVVDQIDTTGLFIQFMQAYQEWKENQQANYENWTEVQKAAYNQFIEDMEGNYNDFVEQSEQAYSDFVEQSEEDYTDYTEGKKTEFNTWYSTYLSEFQDAIEEWFEEIKGQISEDAAVRIQLELNNHENAINNINDMVYHNDFVSTISAENDPDEDALIITNNGELLLMGWSFVEEPLDLGNMNIEDIPNATIGHKGLMLPEHVISLYNLEKYKHRHDNKYVLDRFEEDEDGKPTYNGQHIGEGGTVTGVKMNGVTKTPTGGVVDLGTVITSHQDISGKVDNTAEGINDALLKLSSISDIDDDFLLYGYRDTDVIGEKPVTKKIDILGIWNYIKSKIPNLNVLGRLVDALGDGQTQLDSKRTVEINVENGDIELNAEETVVSGDLEVDGDFISNIEKDGKLDIISRNEDVVIKSESKSVNIIGNNTVDISDGNGNGIVINKTQKAVYINLDDEYGATFSTSGLEVVGDVADSKGSLDEVRQKGTSISKAHANVYTNSLKGAKTSGTAGTDNYVTDRLDIVGGNTAQKTGATGISIKSAGTMVSDVGRFKVNSASAIEFIAEKQIRIQASDNVVLSADSNLDINGNLIKIVSSSEMNLISNTDFIITCHNGDFKTDSTNVEIRTYGNFDIYGSNVQFGEENSGHGPYYQGTNSHSFMKSNKVQLTSNGTLELQDIQAGNIIRTGYGGSGVRGFLLGDLDNPTIFKSRYFTSFAIKKGRTFAQIYLTFASQVFGQDVSYAPSISIPTNASVTCNGYIVLDNVPRAVRGICTDSSGNIYLHYFANMYSTKDDASIQTFAIPNTVALCNADIVIYTPRIHEVVDFFETE